MREHLLAFVALINLDGLDQLHLGSLPHSTLLQELNFLSGLDLQSLSELHHIYLVVSTLVSGPVFWLNFYILYSLSLSDSCLLFHLLLLDGPLTWFVTSPCLEADSGWPSSRLLVPRSGYQEDGARLFSGT